MDGRTDRSTDRYTAPAHSSPDAEWCDSSGWCEERNPTAANGWSHDWRSRSPSRSGWRASARPWRSFLGSRRSFSATQPAVRHFSNLTLRLVTPSTGPVRKRTRVLAVLGGEAREWPLGRTPPELPELRVSREEPVVNTVTGLPQGLAPPRSDADHSPSRALK